LLLTRTSITLNDSVGIVTLSLRKYSIIYDKEAVQRQIHITLPILLLREQNRNTDDTIRQFINA